MTARARRVFVFGLALVTLAAVPPAARMLRGGNAGRCALDGVAVTPEHRVRVVDASGVVREFCCVDCAGLWSDAASARPREVLVTDESGGRTVRAEEAWFARSSVVAFAPTGCRIHVFADEAAARRHASAFRGVVLAGDERPFHESFPITR